MIRSSPIGGFRCIGGIAAGATRTKPSDASKPSDVPGLTSARCSTPHRSPPSRRSPRSTWRAGRGSDADRAALAAEVRQICHEIGFFQLVGHGVPAGFRARYFDLLQAFFALPEDVKAEIDKVRSPHFRGWERVGAELTDNRTDFREQLDVSTENPPYPPDAMPPYLRLDGPNQWLPDDVLPGFHRAVTSSSTASAPSPSS